jgi:hypothetical protein
MSRDARSISDDQKIDIRRARDSSRAQSRSKEALNFLSKASIIADENSGQICRNSQGFRGSPGLRFRFVMATRVALISICTSRKLVTNATWYQRIDIKLFGDIIRGINRQCERPE